MDQKFFDDMRENFQRMLPPGAEQLRADMEAQMKLMMQSAFERMDLVTREEFDLQAALLARCEERLHQLELRVQQLEGPAEEEDTPAPPQDDPVPPQA